MFIPATRDMLQECGENLESPEIRVWRHPHTGDDYYEVFDTFKEAMEFAKTHSEAEDSPLIAFRGYEINIFAITPLKDQKTGVKSG